MEAIRESGGEVIYDYELDASGEYHLRREAARPGLVRKLLGDDFFANVVKASVAGDDMLAHVRNLIWLKELDASEVTDTGLVIYTT